jgi:hypothetical protein
MIFAKGLRQIVTRVLCSVHTERRPAAENIHHGNDEYEKDLEERIDTSREHTSLGSRKGVLVYSVA